MAAPRRIDAPTGNLWATLSLPTRLAPRRIDAAKRTMACEPIEYFNRYTGRIETEDVYGHRFLCWTYGNPLGRLTLHAMVKRAFFSRWYGGRMDRPGSR